MLNEPYFGTYILSNYQPLSKAAKGPQGGSRQSKTHEQNHSPTDILRGSGHKKSESRNRQWRGIIKIHSMIFCLFICNILRVHMKRKHNKTIDNEYTWRGRIIAHYLGGSYDRHIYFVVFCTGCVVRSVPPTQEYSSQRAIFSSSVPGHSSLPKY